MPDLLFILVPAALIGTGATVFNELLNKRRHTNQKEK